MSNNRKKAIAMDNLKEIGALFKNKNNLQNTWRRLQKQNLLSYNSQRNWMPQIQENSVNREQEQPVIFKFNHSSDLVIPHELNGSASSNHSRQASGVMSRGHRRMLSRRNSMLSSGNWSRRSSSVPETKEAGSLRTSKSGHLLEQLNQDDFNITLNKHLLSLKEVGLSDMPEELLLTIVEYLGHGEQFNLCVASCRSIPQMWGVVLVAYSWSLKWIQ